ncbi:MAG: T9SS type A sorting domain-containing protein [Bacteroidales bacterium]|nr:T9SS type A sorting domain-containing protein [Bacteroidales bacterium]
MKLSKFLLTALFISTIAFSYSNGVIIPSDSSQNDFLKTYKLILDRSHVDLRFTNGSMDTILFPRYGEYSVYWKKSGTDQGSFVLPDVVPSNYSSVTSSLYNQYDWFLYDNYSIQFKRHYRRVAIFRSSIKKNNNPVSWESIYFKNTFDSYLYGNIQYFVDEQDINSSDLHSQTKLLIIPSFTIDGTNNKFYIDSVFAITPNMKARIDTFLAHGGMIYAEGNAAYFIEKLGYLIPGAVDFNNSIQANPITDLLDIEFTSSINPLAYTKHATGNFLYASSVPTVNVGSAEVIANIANGGTPVAFVMKGLQANGGRIVCNTGLPTVGGYVNIQDGSRQLQWTLNAIMYTFVKNVDVTRSIYNELLSNIVAGQNAISYDAIDTFEVKIIVRNVSSNTISNLEVKENIRNYFEFVDVDSSGFTYTINNNELVFSIASVPAHSEYTLIYRLRTPAPDDPIHENVDNYISWSNYIYASYNTTSYNDNEGFNSFNKYRNYTDVMFSAKIVADTDLNWKNFLGLYYQPFKVFMIMENKERTAAENTVYTQYIPKDVPFYWTNKSINIPILKTPGGRYVDILKGSNDENNPDYDMDSDGHPDVWLDTASIYPKGYTIVEDSVYWLNPWEHLMSGLANAFYEDIDHDGLIAQDLDGDGIVDIDEPGDKIRVWKVTWNINNVPGYQFYDPYCSYEIWVDPPDLVKLSAGVGYVNGICDSVGGMFYPYSPDINNPDTTETCWENWMESVWGYIVWKQLIYQQINNYEGFTFVDTSTYTLLPTDSLIGTVPQPHREFIAVLSMGGEEIDMFHPTPQSSLYSNIDYKTIFNEVRNTPIRTTYTYYAPLPNPLQFEYLTNNYTIQDPVTNDTLKFLPVDGFANISFDLDASTEYTYYWIRNAGHDVDYNDPSLANEGVEELGDGVFGYMVYDIPKGLGGYKITLPKINDSTYDINAIVEVNGQPFQKWIDNPNTGDSVEILEDQFEYHVYIPQLLIPPALDDDNFDGIDDWIDDRGDRFCSSTGYLHDGFMLDDGEDWPDYPLVPFLDDIYGWVDSGWYCGQDSTYGDDFFENLGKTHFKIHAIYEGKGKEGPIEISKGGWLVVEEIFGGSPWVIFSHTLSGWAQGVNFQITSSSNPSMVKTGVDSVFIKHTVEDLSEPHEFDIDFDPYHVSYGYGESTITSYAGGRDPCSLIDPPITMHTIIDPSYDNHTVTLIPMADTSNPDLTNYPRVVSGSFLELRIEVVNGTDDNWYNTTITTHLPPELGNTFIEMSYVAYPRPLVPAKVDPATGAVIHSGDQIGSFSAGWRFNQPDGEVLVKMGDTLNLMQPSRRAYFIILLNIDPNLANGVYDIDFTISGQRVHYDGTANGNIDYEVPDIQFSITDRNPNGSIVEFQPLVIGQADLTNIEVKTKNNFKGLENVKWSLQDVNYTNFDGLTNTFPASYDSVSSIETIDLSSIANFPTKDTTEFYILEMGEVTSSISGDNLLIANASDLNYSYDQHPYTVSSQNVRVTPVGPQLGVFRNIFSVNGVLTDGTDSIYFPPQSELVIGTTFEVTNFGNDISSNSILYIYPGPEFIPVIDSLPAFFTYNFTLKHIETLLGSFIPGQTKEYTLYFNAVGLDPDSTYDVVTVVSEISGTYEGEAVNATYKYRNTDLLICNLYFDFEYDFEIINIFTNIPVISYDSDISIIAFAKNGAITANDVWMRMYTLFNSGLIQIGERLISEFNGAFSEGLSVNNYSIASILDTLSYIPDSITFVAVIDDGNDFIELDEFNNSRSVTIPLMGGITISGSVSYYNSYSTPLGNSMVYFENTSEATMDSIETNQNGEYSYISYNFGTYNFDAASNIQWGGSNSIDAFLIQRHFLGMNYLNGLALDAADVDGSGFINTDDALNVQMRFVHLISTFPVGDWVFNANPMTINYGGNYSNIIIGSCYGDVNNSYTPPSVKMEPTIDLKRKGSLEIASYEEYEIPVKAEKEMNVSSISLVFSYPHQIMNIISVSINDQDKGNLLYTSEDGELRISWVSTNSLKLNKGDILFNIKFATDNILAMVGEKAPFEIMAYSEFGDEIGEVIDNVKLSTPGLFIGLPTEFSLGHNYPNPFNNITEISYALPEEGYVILKVFNLLGEQIAVLARAQQGPGIYSVEFDCSGLTAGVYLYKIDVKGKTKNFVQTKRMVVTGK